MNIENHSKECDTSEVYIHLKNSILKMQAKFDEYWPKIKEDALACQLLDPRFKHSTIKSTVSKQTVGFFKFQKTKTIFLIISRRSRCLIQFIVNTKQSKLLQRQIHKPHNKQKNL